MERQIDVIVGGPTVGGDSSSARKAYARAEVQKSPRVQRDPKITFKFENEYPDHEDTLVILTRIANACVKRIMIDTGNSTDILYFDAFQKLDMTDRDLTSMTLTLIGFTGDAIAPIGIVTFPVTFGDEPRTKTLMVPFMVVELPLAYNVIIDQPTLNKLRAIVSMYHRSIKFPTSAGAREVRSDQHESRQCYLKATIIPKKVKKEAPIPDPREPDTRFSAQADRADIGGALDKHSPERTIRVGSTLPEDRHIQLVNFLERNADVFAWSPSDMSGVRPEIAQHRLSTIPMLRNLSGCITCVAKIKTTIGFPRKSNHHAKH
ncbi:hypothetical protein GW17_00035764 [Ensete ventricosum]|nr:hypothetical protein GW17_00035764 [Ensete ventricosum]